MLKDRLRSLREQHDFSQAKLAEILGVSPAAYSTYEMGTRDVSSDKVVKLAKFYGVSTDYLYDIEDNQSGFDNLEITIIKKYRTLDGYGKKVVDSVLDIEYDRCTVEQPTIEIQLCELPASAGTGEFLSEEMTSIIEIPDTPLNRSADFIVQVSGDSMQPEYNDDDFLLVRKQETVEEGEVGIFVLNGCGYVKRFGGDRLISINSKYKDIKYGEYDNIVCYGKVIGKV